MHTHRERERGGGWTCVLCLERRQSGDPVLDLRAGYQNRKEEAVAGRYTGPLPMGHRR